MFFFLQLSGSKNLSEPSTDTHTSAHRGTYLDVKLIQTIAIKAGKPRASTHDSFLLSWRSQVWAQALHSDFFLHLRVLRSLISSLQDPSPICLLFHILLPVLGLICHQHITEAQPWGAQMTPSLLEDNMAAQSGYCLTQGPECVGKTNTRTQSSDFPLWWGTRIVSVNVPSYSELCVKPLKMWLILGVLLTGRCPVITST